MERGDLDEHTDEHEEPSELALKGEAPLPWWARPSIAAVGLVALLALEVFAATRAPGAFLRWGLVLGAFVGLAGAQVLCARGSRAKVAFDTRGVWGESDGSRWHWPWRRVASITVSAASVVFRHASGGEARVARRGGLDVPVVLALAPADVPVHRSEATGPRRVGVLALWILLAVVMAAIVSFIGRQP